LHQQRFESADAQVRLGGQQVMGMVVLVVMLFAMAGMAVGGWLGGAIFDLTLSYRTAFQAALAFNLLNLMLLGGLYLGQRRRLATAFSRL
jgi:hypothetical protein